MSEHKKNDNVLVSQTENTILKKTGRVDLVKSSFDDLVLQKGYAAYVDKALRCPCRNKLDSQPLSDCKNCGGSGYIFINRTKTRIVLQGMGSNVDYKEWSETEMGTAKITALQELELAYMDRVTIMNGFAIHNQSVFCQIVDAKVKGKLIYTPLEISEIYLFEGSAVKLKFLLPETDFTVNDNVITLNDSYIPSHSDDNPLTLSVRYKHNPQYHIIDIPRDTIASYKRDAGSEVNQTLPNHAIARKAHYVLDETNYGVEWLFNNDYTPECSIWQASNDIVTIIRKTINVENSDQTLEELLSSGAFLTIVSEDTATQTLLSQYTVDQVDDVTSDVVIYVGKLKGDYLTSGKWLIEKITVAESGDEDEDVITIEYFNGDVIGDYATNWDNRVGLTYVADTALTNL